MCCCCCCCCCCFCTPTKLPLGNARVCMCIYPSNQLSSSVAQCSPILSETSLHNPLHFSIRLW
ncbi:hypothetical protein DsansV1_C20g0165621 [Dioscorea sansibarensis]